MLTWQEIFECVLGGIAIVVLIVFAIALPFILLNLLFPGFMG